MLPCMSSSFCFKLLFFISKLFFRITGLLIVSFVKVIAIYHCFFYYQVIPEPSNLYFNMVSQSDFYIFIAALTTQCTYSLQTKK